MDGEAAKVMNLWLKNEDPKDFVSRIRSKILEGSVAKVDLQKLILLVLLSVHESSKTNDLKQEGYFRRTSHVASIC